MGVATNWRKATLPSEIFLDEFIEVESGKRADRAQLAAAIAHANQHKAPLLIAKLDRLSRNVSFIFHCVTPIKPPNKEFQAKQKLLCFHPRGTRPI